MFLSDSTSSQAAQRQRRIAADERLRVDKVVNDAAVRESVARQVGEAPARDEVDRFRALMQARGNTLSATAKAPTRDTDAAQPRIGAGEAEMPPPPDESSTPTIADRFRALLQRAAGSSHDAGAHGEKPSERCEAPTQEPPRAETETPRTTSSAPRAEVGQRALPGEAKPVCGNTDKPGSADAKPAQEEAGGEVGQDADAGDAKSAQKLTQKAAHGEANIAPAARNAHRGRTSDGGGDKDALSDLSRASGIAAPAMPVDMASIAPAPPRLGDGPQQAAVAAGVIAPGIAELLEKHVKQMLVSDSRGTRLRSREVLLRMQSDILPGTDLWLTQTRNGWQLRADVRSRDAYDTLLANQDELIQRFADSALGELSIEPVFHG